MNEEILKIISDFDTIETTAVNVKHTIMVGGLVGFALKYMQYINMWVYLPAIPNVFDVVFIMASAVFLGWRALKSG